MNLGELLTAIENYIFSFTQKQFIVNNIPPSMQRLIMEAVYSKFQAVAIDDMIAGQTSYERNEAEKDESKEEKPDCDAREMVKTLKEFYEEKTDVEEGKNGGSENSTAQA